MALSRSALAAVFRRSGASGEHTTLYEDAPAGTQQRVGSALRESGVDDEPIVVTMFSPDDWNVITTRGVLVVREGQTKLLSADDVLRVEPVWNEGTFRKTELNTLAISLRDGDTLLIRTDTGEPFSGVWNVLKTFEAQAAT